jgi:signal peptidase I
MRDEADTDTKPTLLAEVLDWTRFFALTAAILLVPRTVLAQPFMIPSGSMEPTLEIGDRILVSKYAYGWSRHALPFSPPVGHGRLMGREPERGDIVVFKRPGDGRTDIIKRLVGLPGDRIQVRNGVLMINGAAVEHSAQAIRVTRDHGYPVVVQEVAERLPNGRSYLTHVQRPHTPAANTGLYQVPADCYFVMGDNRDNSVDSRFDPGAVRAGDARCAWDSALDRHLPPETGMGYVPAENLVGRAERVLFSWEPGKGPRWSRTFKSLSADSFTPAT